MLRPFQYRVNRFLRILVAPGRSYNHNISFATVRRTPAMCALLVKVVWCLPPWLLWFGKRKATESHADTPRPAEEEERPGHGESAEQQLEGELHPTFPSHPKQ